MGESGRYPGSFIMADGTVGWELRGIVVWICRRYIVCIMAIITSIRSIRISAVVTVIAVCYGRMRSNEWEGAVVE